MLTDRKQNNVSEKLNTAVEGGQTESNEHITAKLDSIQLEAKNVECYNEEKKKNCKISTRV